MANYIIGDMIHDSRVKKGYSQKKLCNGICSTSALSRIENNLQVPGRRIFEALMQRLGVSGSFYSVYVSKEEMELYRITGKLVCRLENWEIDRNCNEAANVKLIPHANIINMEVIIGEFEKRIRKSDILNCQFLEFAKASVKKYRGESLEHVLKDLLDAIHMTIPDYDENGFLQGKLLTFDEITILNNIALINYDLGKKWKGLQLLIELKEYLEEHMVDEEEKAKKYPMILYYIASWLREDGGRHHEAYNLSDTGIHFCRKHNKLMILPYLIANKGHAAAELKRKEEAETLFQQACTLFVICNKEQMIHNMREEIKLRYDIAI